MSVPIADLAVSLAKAAIVLFIIVDPFGNVPIFMGLTEKMANAERRKVFNTAILIGIILLLVFAFTGQEIFLIFGISIYSFEVAGGILLLIISIRILISGSLREDVESPESIGAVPIAMPLLVGPGAITTTILNLQAYGTIVTILSVLVVMLLTWVILRYVNSIYKFLGKTGSIVIARVMALLIAAIAIQYILVGISHFLEALQ
ncbi:MAG: MarC family protein [Candidatus Bathyarchaeota archaeon]|nr:MarC family protein [Candidatus Bathyarchaeota archaeon]